MSSVLQQLRTSDPVFQIEINWRRNKSSMRNKQIEINWRRNKSSMLNKQTSGRASRLGNATSQAARKTAGSFEKALRNTIENQPYTAVAIAVGLGWLLGRMHRPL
jgi:ElaB/YqjD/DUF883 family membrane-anchored ribosome-binding protein